MADKKLLALVMIVKNEANSMRRIIESVRDYIDYYAIVDTGSTDGTVEIARDALKGIDGVIESHPFVDFSTTRNLSLDLAKDHAEFALWLSGDETLVEDRPGQLRKACEEAQGGDYSAFALKVRMVPDTTAVFLSTRVLRLDGKWRFRGVVHETPYNMTDDNRMLLINGCYVDHDLSTADPERRRLRWYHDLELLQEQLIKDPDDSRSQFYLAQTLEDLGFYAQAFEAYGKRVGMVTPTGAFDEEQYEATYRMARTGLQKGDPWPQVQDLLLTAFHMQPRHAEPLFYLAQYHFAAGNYGACWVYAFSGAMMPMPTEFLMFVDPEVYSWKMNDLAGLSGLYVKHYKLGEDFCRKALENCPESERARIIGNLAHYEKLRLERGTK